MQQMQHKMHRGELELPRQLKTFKCQLICISERHVIDTHAASQRYRYRCEKDVLADDMQMSLAVTGSFILAGMPWKWFDHWLPAMRKVRSMRKMAITRKYLRICEIQSNRHWCLPAWHNFQHAVSLSVLIIFLIISRKFEKHQNRLMALDVRVMW